MRKEVEKYIQKKYGAGPEHLWRSYPEYSVFRHADNRKWFAIVMDVDSNKNLTIKALMKIQLQKRYKADKFTFEVLRDEYGIAAIRGPRGITNSLSAALK